MECPECGSKAIVAEKKEIRHNQGEPITEFRTYVCSNWQCLYGFVYKNTYMRPTERLDTAQFMRRYERAKAERSAGQEALNFEDEED